MSTVGGVSAFQINVFRVFTRPYLGRPPNILRQQRCCLDEKKTEIRTQSGKFSITIHDIYLTFSTILKRKGLKLPLCLFMWGNSSYIKFK